MCSARLGYARTPVNRAGGLLIRMKVLHSRTDHSTVRYIAQCKFRHVYITYVSRHLQSMKRASHSISFAIVLHYMQHTQRHTYLWKFSALHLSGSIVLLQFVNCMPLPVYIGHDYFLKLIPMIRLTAPKASLSAFNFAIISGRIQGHISVTGWHKHPLDMEGIPVLLLT